MDIAITEVFHSAEQNFRDRADADWLARAEKLNDISNERYFEVLMRKTALEDPVLQRQPIRSPLARVGAGVCTTNGWKSCFPHFQTHLK